MVHHSVKYCMQQRRMLLFLYTFIFCFLIKKRCFCWKIIALHFVMIIVPFGHKLSQFCFLNSSQKTISQLDIIHAYKLMIFLISNKDFGCIPNMFLQSNSSNHFKSSSPDGISCIFSSRSIRKKHFPIVQHFRKNIKSFLLYQNLLHGSLLLYQWERIPLVFLLTSSNLPNETRSLDPSYHLGCPLIC